MAGTRSPRSDPAAGRADDRRPALARFLAEASGAAACEITGLTPLSGGSIQENWGLDANFSGGRLDGEQRLVLRAAAMTGVPSSLDRMQEFAVLKAAFAAGVTVPEPLFASADPAVFGKPFLVMRRAPGTARRASDHPRPGARPGTAGDRRAARAGAGADSRDPAAAARSRLSASRRATSGAAHRRVSRLSRPSPRAPAGARMGHALARDASAGAVPPVLCHHDFRTGNYLLDGAS